jgi:hypothetical protein
VIYITPHYCKVGEIRLGTKERLEIEVTNLFTTYTEKIFSVIHVLIDGVTLNLAWELGEKFLFVCKEIERDPRFVFMNNFRSYVQNKNNEMNVILTSLETKREEGAEKAINKEAIEQFKPLYMGFYRDIDKIQAQLIGIMTVKPANEFEYYLNKSRLLIKSQNIRNFTPEQEQAIQAYHARIPADQLKQFQKPLSLQQELKLFDDYRLAIEYQLVDFEDKGWYNSVRMYCRLWIEYLKKIAQYHQEYNRLKIVKKIQEEIEKITEWVKRIEIKYEKGIMLDVKQSELLSDHIRQMIVRYREDRKELKRADEDKQILKLLTKKN